MPVLTMVARRASEDSDLKLLAIRSIAQINPADSIPLLRDALQNPRWAVRLSAAEGLAKTNDQSIVYELNVVASRESNRDCRLQMQALADAMQTRLRSQPKTAK
jgi:HEAT repeat protein